jgi:hypothetical protein
MTVDLQPQRVDTGGGGFVGGSLEVGRDYIGRDQNLYQYFLGKPSLADKLTQPYVVDRPFKVTEHLLFTGREEDIERVLGQMVDPDKRTIILFGPADVGKTSLVTAGILPQLSRLPQTTAVITLRTFGQASVELQRQLHGSAVGMGLEIPEKTSVPELVAALTRNPDQRLLLILDQFERFFQPGVSDVERDTLRTTLDNAMTTAGPHWLKILIAVRDDVQSELDRQWGDLLPDMRQTPIYVQPLTRDQAKRAIQHPLQELGVQPVFDERLLDDRLLDDLDALSFEQPGRILPADLQAVCSKLWHTAKMKGKYNINTTLYYEITDGKGAEQIVDLHFDGLLARIGAGRRDLARDIVAALLDRGAQAWLTPEQLAAGDAAPNEIQVTLDEMHTAGIVNWHATGGRQAYTLASDSIARAADRALGRKAQKRRQARWELEHAWRDWLADDSLTGQHQLNLIQREWSDDPPPPEKGLFLLASAVTRQAQVDHWLKQLDTDAARDLIRTLEEQQVGRSGAAEPSAPSTPHSQASRILALAEDDEDLPYRPESAEIGAVTWSAAAHKKKADCRETSALALLVGYSPDAPAQSSLEETTRHKPDALERVESAVKKGRLGRRRMAELRGILADASPPLAARMRKKPLLDRIEVWGWRFRRRVLRDLPYIGSVALGGAIGAGCGLGLIRAAMAPLVQQRPGYAFYAAFAVASLFGLTVSLGLLLVNAIRLRPAKHESDATNRRPLLPDVAAGALAFFVMQGLHLLLFGSSGWAAAAWAAMLALPAGAGVSTAIHNLPIAGRRISAWRWMLRLAAAAGALALVQALYEFTLDPEYGPGLVFAWPGSYYERTLRDTLIHWKLNQVLTVPNWFRYTAVIDAGLMGIALALGVAVGLNVANRWFEKWESLANRAGE